MAFDPKHYAGAAAGAAAGFLVFGPIGAAFGALAGYVGQTYVEKTLTPHWVLTSPAVLHPGDYFAVALIPPKDWNDAHVAMWKQSLAALGYDTSQVSPKNPLAPTPPTGSVALQGRFRGPTARPLDVPANSGGAALLIIHPQSAT